MLDRLTPEQLFVFQSFMIENADRDGVSYSPVANQQACDSCSDCMGTGETCASSTSYHRCSLCDGKLYIGMDGIGSCESNKCNEVSEFYGIKLHARKCHGTFLTDTTLSMKAAHKTNRYRTASFFKKEGSQSFHFVTFNELYFGIDLEIKTELNKAIKQLREVVKNGIT